MTDTTNTITAPNAETLTITPPDPVAKMTINVSVGDTMEKYVLPTVLHTPGYPIASLVAAVLRLHQRVEELEETISELKGATNG